MNAIDLLVRHHRHLEQLLEKLGEAEGDEKHRLFTEAADFLVTHFTIEERCFYPAVRAARTEDILLESLEEHLSLKRVLADLVTLAPGDASFEPKLHVLEEQTEHHHHEEEEHLFPKARKILDEARLEALGAEMQKMADELDRHEKPRCLVLGQTDEAAPLGGKSAA